jgi:hypothetical protein
MLTSTLLEVTCQINLRVPGTEQRSALDTLNQLYQSHETDLQRGIQRLLTQVHYCEYDAIDGSLVLDGTYQGSKRILKNFLETMAHHLDDTQVSVSSCHVWSIKNHRLTFSNVRASDVHGADDVHVEW